MTIRCDYCDRPPDRVTGHEIYPHHPDLRAKHFWLCRPCKAYVGCHPGSDRSLGRLANAELRLWKQRAHAAFDPLWKSGKMKRRQAYIWLAEKLGRSEANTHIGMFDVELCKQVISVVQALDRTPPLPPPGNASRSSADRDAPANAKCSADPAPSHA